MQRTFTTFQISDHVLHMSQMLQAIEVICAHENGDDFVSRRHYMAKIATVIRCAQLMGLKETESFYSVKMQLAKMTTEE